MRKIKEILGYAVKTDFLGKYERGLVEILCENERKFEKT